MRFTFTLLFMAFYFSAIAQCSNVLEEYDEFDNVKKYSSGYFQQIRLFKEVRAKETRYYLMLQTAGSTLNVGEKGVKCILSDNSKFERPQQKINVDYSSGKYIYSAFITISEIEVKRLVESPITKYKLFIYDQNVSKSQQKKASLTMRCILEKS